MFKGDLVGNLHESLISAGFKVGYLNRKKELFLPMTLEGVLLLRCSNCPPKSFGKYCRLSAFQFLKENDACLHAMCQGDF